ncbi:hypothetical protein Tco_0227907, partial [Tanacetum coccineum]
VDAFACPVSFPWHTDKNVYRDPLPKSTEFNVDDYAVLVAHPAPFQKFPEPFLCLVGMSRYYTMDENAYPRFLHDNGEEMDLFAFIHVVDPTKVKIVEREHVKEERKLLDSTVGCVVPFLPVASACSKGDLEVSVDRLFDEGGSTNQGDSAIGGGHNAVIEPVTDVKDIAAENVTAERPKRQCKKSEVATGGKSPSVIKELLTSSILNAEHEGAGLIDSVTGPNLRTIGSSERFIISSDSSHHSSINAAKVEVDSFTRSATPLSVMTEAVVSTSIASAPSIPVPEAAANIFLHSWMDYTYWFTECKVLGFARQACLNAKVRMRTEYCLNERRRLEFECKRQADLLKVSVVEAAEKVHADELDALKQNSVALEDENDSLNGKITELQSSVSAKDLELKDFNVTVSSLKSQNDDLVDQVCACIGDYMFQPSDQVSGYERLKEQIEEFQDARINIVNDKVAKLDADLVEMALYLEEKFYPHLLTIISGRRWFLTCGLKLAVVKCLNLPEYLTALGAAISRAIEKGMQSGLSAGIDHGKEGRRLADVVAYNPAAEADYNSALQRLCEVDFPLIQSIILLFPTTPTKTNNSTSFYKYSCRTELPQGCKC